MSLLTDFDFTSTVRDFDYTKRAIQNMNRILDSQQFEEMDTEAIFDYLKQEMQIVSFKDFLRRYIYNKAGIRETFSTVPDEVYIDIILSSFEEHGAPFSFTPTKRKKRASVKIWLSQESVGRTNMFTIAFGLGMTEGDVSEFLTKVLKEDDFDFFNPEEVIYFYCYHNALHYADAKELQNFYEALPETGNANKKLWELMRNSPALYAGDKEMIREYLTCLKWDQENSTQKQKARWMFDDLYKKVCGLIREKYWVDDGNQEKNRKEVLPADVEHILCSGIPLDAHNNLKKMSFSILAPQFEQKRMSRQRISKIQRGAQVVERFDLITLLFFIYAVDVEPDWPTERYLQYIEEVNRILHEAGMSDIYPVNPYEAFVLMCLLTEDPMYSYGEIWELSFTED